MPTPRKNQKQIARRYVGNTRYFSRLNPFRCARLLLMLGCLALAVVGAFFYLKTGTSSRRIEALNTSGPISQAHSSFAHDCKKCHDPEARIDPLQPAVVNSTIDAKCEVCHTRHTFHAATVVTDHSCTDCHHEHLGAGRMQLVKDVNCVTCHGNAESMQASAQKGAQFPITSFAIRPVDHGQTYFQPPRPAQGYTQIIHAFAEDHPDFQIQRENLTDPNTLKFNHKIHLTGDIPMVNGRKLDCAYCHQPDGRGAYMQPIRFAKNCQACHSLQVDPGLPDFQLPHPTGPNQVNSVRDFLLTLPTQYATYAAQIKGMTNTAEIAAFVKEHMSAIRQRVRQGADLEKDMFYADARQVNLGTSAPATAQERALFPGCAYCHEVKTGPAQEPEVTPPVTPDRWFVHARFDHSAHVTMSCESCHGKVLQSEKTSEINLPDKASCVTCHSPKGRVVNSCATCHDYHNQMPVRSTATAPPSRDVQVGTP